MFNKMNCRVISLGILFTALSNVEAMGGPIIDDAVFAHDFENGKMGLKGPDYTSNGFFESTFDPLPFSSTHVRAANSDANPLGPKVSTNTKLTSPLTSMSFSMFYNGRGDDGNEVDFGSARFLSTFDGGGTPPHSWLVFDSIESSSSTRVMRFFLVDGLGGVTSVSSTASFAARDSIWHQVGFIFQSGATDGTVSFYLDGTQFGAPVTTTGFNAIPEMKNDWTLFEDANIGFEPHQYFDDGDYDDAALWNRALSAAEMNSLYNQGLAAAENETSAVPEPSALALMGIGAICLLVCHRRSRRQAAPLNDLVSNCA